MTKTQLCICINYKNIKIKGLQDKLAELEKELENKVRHLNQVIYNTAKVSFEAGACSINADFHESAEVFAKMMFKRNSE